jgi:isoleucyl-tRNA synthetase
VHLAPACLGRAAGALHASRDGRAAPRNTGVARACRGACAGGGIDAWFDLDPADLLGSEAAQYEKVTDIMDVWVDSGVSHHCVAKTRPEVRIPADLYLEGSDQHRGWFHSSLLTSVAQKGHAPYRGVLTHGFTVDEKGRKMSKSLGNVVLPQKVVSTLGADVLRLWVAATDYANEISVSDEILKRTADSYRRIRNTARFLLGNLHGFDPQADAVPYDELVSLDAWAIGRARALQAEIVAAYRDYAFHVIYQKIHNFCVVDLGGFYLDVIKDRLYTTGRRSHARRSAQTAMQWIAEALVALARADTLVHRGGNLELHGGPVARIRVLRDLGTTAGARLRRRGNRGRDRLGQGARGPCGAACGSSSVLRVAERIGAPLDASVDLYCAPGLLDVLRPLGRRAAFHPDRLGRTRARRAQRPADAVAGEGFALGSRWDSRNSGSLRKPSTATKCVRCWHKRDDVGVRRGASRALCALRQQRRRSR